MLSDKMIVLSHRRMCSESADSTVSTISCFYSKIKLLTENRFYGILNPVKRVTEKFDF